MTSIANTIDSSIKMEASVPSDFANKKLPLLNTQVWIENTKEGPQVRYEFYEKPMATRLLVDKESAIGERERRTIHTQGLIRVIRNCHEDLHENELNKSIENYLKKTSKFRL